MAAMSLSETIRLHAFDLMRIIQGPIVSAEQVAAAASKLAALAENRFAEETANEMILYDRNRLLQENAHLRAKGDEAVAYIAELGQKVGSLKRERSGAETRAQHLATALADVWQACWSRGMDAGPEPHPNPTVCVEAILQFVEQILRSRDGYRESAQRAAQELEAVRDRAGQELKHAAEVVWGAKLETNQSMRERDEAVAQRAAAEQDAHELSDINMRILRSLGVRGLTFDFSRRTVDVDLADGRHIVVPAAF